MEYENRVNDLFEQLDDIIKNMKFKHELDYTVSTLEGTIANLENKDLSV